MCFRERERKIRSVKAWRILKPDIEGQLGSFTDTVYLELIEPNTLRTSPIYKLTDNRLFARIATNTDVMFKQIEASSAQIQSVKWFLG